MIADPPIRTMPGAIRSVAHRHDTPTGTYIDGCPRCELERRYLRADDTSPAVYLAGPVDYIEHRSPDKHRIENWRHRFFSGLAVEVLCPTCMNAQSAGWEQVMAVNAAAMSTADLFIGYFPGDVATFGTPIEVWTWVESMSFIRNLSPGALIHPARKGVFVEHLEARGMTVLRDFMEARQWLARQIPR